MRFLVDESSDAAILRALRGAGWDVAAISENCPGARDADVIALAVREQRVLVTEDKDFGQLVYAAGHGHCGVILLRYPFPLASRVAARLVTLARERGESLIGAFVVVRPAGVRIQNPPRPG